MWWAEDDVAGVNADDGDTQAKQQDAAAAAAAAAAADVRLKDHDKLATAERLYLLIVCAKIDVLYYLHFFLS